MELTLTQDHGAHAAAVLSRAFYDDPVSKFTWRNDSKRAAQSLRCFEAQLRVMRDVREVEFDPTLSSVAVWARPDEWRVPLRASLRLLPPFLRNGVRLRSIVAPGQGLGRSRAGAFARPR